MVKMAIYTQKCEQKWPKINDRGRSNKDVLGGKKSKNEQSGEGRNDYSGLESRSTLLTLKKLIITLV